MHGFLNIDKPAGMTSRDVVNGVQRLIRPAKVGHAGTLDPLARGVLVVAIGDGTRLIEYVQRMRKTYRGEFLFGFSSDTEDVEGTLVRCEVTAVPTLEQLQSVASQFIGEIQQVPPAYSALKVNGKRAYALARAGIAPQLRARTVTVYQIGFVEYAFPRWTIDVVCGQGTYIRSLGRDIARRLGSEAVMTGLNRTAIGTFRVENAISYETLSTGNWRGSVLPLRSAVVDLPTIQLGDQELSRLGNGQSIPHTELRDDELAVLGSNGELVSIVHRRGDRLFPERNFMMRQD
jgi:tRNA pseudouridine55 synthase